MLVNSVDPFLPRPSLDSTAVAELGDGKLGNLDIWWKKTYFKNTLKKIQQKPWPPFFRFLLISPKAMGQAGEDEEMAKWMDYSLQRGVPRFLPIRFVHLATQGARAIHVRSEITCFLMWVKQ